MKRQARRKGKLLKKARKIRDTLQEGWSVACQDESVFIYDAVIKKVWALKGSKPRVKVTGSPQEDFSFWFSIPG
jgi:hypothetical protein